MSTKLTNRGTPHSSTVYYFSIFPAAGIVHSDRDIKTFKAVAGKGYCFLNTNMISLRNEEGVSII